MKKYSLQLESLEDRRALAAYTTELLDPGKLLGADVKSKMLSSLDYAVKNVANFVSWKGTLDVRIQINPTLAGYEGGVFSSIDSTTRDNRNAAIMEMTTGVDPYPNDPDCGATVWLARDGTVKVYGRSAYYDPNPVTYVPANVPAGMFDFVGVLTHEIFHGIAVRNTVDFDRYLTKVGGNTFFVGPKTLETLGQPLPYIGGGHYGNTSLPNNPIGSGLMFQWGNYEGNRLDIGRLDLAILQDVGLSVMNANGLPLVDRMDSQIPRNTASNLVVAENVASGTYIGAVSTTQGSSGFTFSLPDLRDNRSFRIFGNSLVTSSLLDYETKNSYEIVVRNTDSTGVWTDTIMNVVVTDVFEAPKIVAPDRVMYGGPINLGWAGVAGDGVTAATLVIFSRKGTISSTINDPALKVYIARNTSGGTTALIVGSVAAINRNTKYLTYAGEDSSLSLDMAATIGGVSRNYGQKSVLLTRISTSPIFPGNNPILRVS
jgi:hypothetical protein